MTHHTVAAATALTGVLLLTLAVIEPATHFNVLPRIADAAPALSPPAAEDLTDVVQQYCVRCHSARRMTGNLSLEDFDVESANLQAATGEKMILKLRT